MIISSELTGERYNTVDECIAAEEEFKAAREKERIEQELKQKAIHEAEEDAAEAFDRYRRLLDIDDEHYEAILIDFIMDMLFNREREDDE